MSKNRRLKILHFAVEEAMAQKVERLAERRGLSLSEFLRRIVVKELDARLVGDDVVILKKKEWDELYELTVRLRSLFGSSSLPPQPAQRVPL